MSFTPHITEFSPTFPLPQIHTPPSSLAVCTPTLPQLFSASGLQIRPRLSCSSTHACGRSLALFPSTVTSPSLPLLLFCSRCCFSGSRRGKSIALSSKLLLLLQLLSCFLLYRCFSFRLVIRESFLASPWFFFALLRFSPQPFLQRTSLTTNHLYCCCWCTLIRVFHCSVSAFGQRIPLFR